MSELSERLPGDYATLLAEVKERVRSAQYEALKAVNKELVALYWDIGKLIAERLANDLQSKKPRSKLRGIEKQSSKDLVGVGLHATIACRVLLHPK